MTLNVSANNSSALLALITPDASATDATVSSDAADRAGAAPASRTGSSVNVDVGPAGSSGLDPVTNAMMRANSISDAAVSAGTSILKLLQQMKADATQAAAATLDTTARANLNADYGTRLKQVGQLVQAAKVDGVNLIDGSQAGLSIPTSADGASTITLSGADLSLGGPLVSVGSTSTLGDASSAANTAKSLDQSLNQVGKALSSLTRQAGKLANQSAFMTSFSQSVFSPSATADVLGDSDAADAVRLSALSLQQGLSSQSAPIASTSSAILSLFRG